MAKHVVDPNQLLIDQFYKIMDECDLDWERYDRVDDYCRECGTEFKLMMDMYILQMPKIAMAILKLLIFM